MSVNESIYYASLSGLVVTGFVWLATSDCPRELTIMLVFLYLACAANLNRKKDVTP